MTEEQMKGANMIFIFGLTYLFGLMLSSGLMLIVIHQMGFYSTLANKAGIEDKSSEIAQYSKQFFETYGTRFRTFKHGLLHGILTSIMIALPVLGINALIERRGAKYIFIHLGYWAITCGLIGGIICQFA
jgi:NADH:ubiquinone oxidoreductase subunit 6 (subunit J)